ncbi:SDR family oxidoreductase [Streptosporangium sp. NPDC049644]|uniref:SDR family NAD(P)-dependent oxidoreductase n=1 Tax=Streptosporangium sp. NPDC049644 TaxID=3155507 RepID=UPI00341A9B4F
MTQSVDPLSVDGTRIVVTGGVSGIGHAIALGLAERGARVAVLDLPGARLEEAGRKAAETGLELTYHGVDVSDEDAVEAGFDAALAALGGIDVVFANAGIAGTVKPVTDWTLQEWRQVISVNLDGAFLTARAALRRMDHVLGKKLIFTASVWGQRGSTTAQCAGYSASKNGVIGLTKQLAADLAAVQVTVNAIAPSGFVTDIAGGMMRDETATAPMLARQPWHRFVEPTEAVGPAVFLSSRASDHVTGHVLALEGGYLAV